MTTTADRQLEDLLEFIRDARGFDFTGYKRPSLARRIAKRLQATRSGTYDEYQSHLEAEPEEFVELFNTVLINVTSFFRDEAAWSFLSQEIVPRLLEARDGDGRLRMWSTGCASGEEAFSLAMTLAEALGDEEFRGRVKIYATDVDEEALDLGRRATYSSKQLEAVPPDYRGRYFESTDGTHVIRSDLRRSVIFGRHDVVKDAPISKIDLLVSRNTLIYFTPETQSQILSGFHFGLREDGYLFLGKAEALAARSSLFAPIDLNRRVFAKVPGAARRRPLVVADDGELSTHDGEDAIIRNAGFDAAPVAQMIVDTDGRLSLANLEARNIFGLTARDLGRPLHELEVSFRPVELRSRIAQAYEGRHAITLREVEWRVGSDVRYVDVQISPLLASTGETLGVGITFADVSRYRLLQEAIQESRGHLETAYEELQSTVEELETTNEELESTNEELEAMNDELNLRTFALNDSSNFFEAVLGGLQAGVIVVNGSFEIRAWNTGARDLWGLTAEETLGEHFLELDIGLPVQELHDAMRTALADGGLPERIEVQAVTRRGRKITCRIALTPLVGGQDGARAVILMMQAVEPVAA
jgi:two-component system, chemotaxis family, CheB/CheR fusion protein